MGDCLANCPSNSSGFCAAAPKNKQSILSSSKLLFIDTVFDVAMLGYDLYCGNYVDAAFDAVAMIIPGIPAGISKYNRLGIIWHRHHKIPKFLGGDNSPGNIIRMAKHIHIKYHKESGHFSKPIREYLKKELSEDIAKLKKYKEWEPKDFLFNKGRKIIKRFPNKKAGCI